MSAATQEISVLETVASQLEAEGYDVYIQPSGPVLPLFLRDNPPDAVALGKDRNLAIEVLRETPSSKHQLDRLREKISGHKGWELRVYFVSPSQASGSIEKVSREVIEQSIKSVRELAAAGNTGPALLLAWATFEALSRALLPDKFVRRQTPQRLIEVLAEDGHVTPGEADHLRLLADTRNQLTHGGLQVRIANADVERLIGILETLLTLLPR
jgi:REase_AHJR-like